MINEEIKLYRITADYRKNNPNKPRYYVRARNTKEAKSRFKNRISWLDIYGVEAVDINDAKVIISEPAKHIII